MMTEDEDNGWKSFHILMAMFTIRMHMMRKKLRLRISIEDRLEYNYACATLKRYDEKMTPKK